MSAAVAGNDTIRVSRAQRLRGSISVPGDKSIAHRALLFGAVASGWTRIVGLPRNADVGATIDALGACGVLIQRNGEAAVVQGCGFDAFARRFESYGKPFEIDCANSGTTMRLLSGILAGANVEAMLMGDASLMKRPMKRIAEPLAKMGASIMLSESGTAPIRVGARRLHGIDYELQVASAQVKSALILAGLFAEGTTRISGKIVSRDHTERLLPIFGSKIEVSDSEICVTGGQSLQGAFVRVPGDPSSAAFWIAAAMIVPDADIVVHGVGANPSRIAFIDIIRRMGAHINVESQSEFPEPIATLHARSSQLQGVELGGSEVALAIDELPLIAVLATQARGMTVVRDARELRVKESDRIDSVAAMLYALGGKIETFDDGFAIEGPQQLRAGRVEPHRDHRIAMAGAIAALVAEGESQVADPASAAVSYPTFFLTLAELGGEVV